MAKISFDNAASLALFGKLGFEHESSSDAFREHTLRSTERTTELARAEVGASGPTEQEDLDAEVEALRKAGNAAFAAGDYYRAVAAYDRAVETDERDAVLFSNRSHARLRCADP